MGIVESCTDCLIAEAAQHLNDELGRQRVDVQRAAEPWRLQFVQIGTPKIVQYRIRCAQIIAQQLITTLYVELAGNDLDFCLRDRDIQAINGLSMGKVNRGTSRGEHDVPRPEVMHFFLLVTLVKDRYGRTEVNANRVHRHLQGIMAGRRHHPLNYQPTPVRTTAHQPRIIDRSL